MEEREDRISVTEETGKGKKENKYRHTIVTKESFCAVFALFSVLAFLILLTDSAVFGEPGAYVRSLLIALFGYAAYPVALLGAYNCAMGFVGVKLFKKRAAVTALLITAVLVALAGHTVQTLFVWKLPVDGYLSACFNAEELGRGATVFGYIGALPVYLLATLTTEVGALVILSALAVLCLYVTAKLVAGKAVKTEKKAKFRKEKNVGAQNEYADGEMKPQAPNERPQSGYYEDPNLKQAYPADPYGGFRRTEETPQPLSGYDTHSFDPQSMGGNQPYVPYTVHRHPSFNIKNATENAPAQAQPMPQEQGGMGYSPFGSATSMQPPAQSISQDEARRILFSSTPQQNYQDNRMFNRDSRVNNRGPIEQPVPYSDQYRQSVQNTPPARPQKVVGDAGENFGRRQSNPYGLDQPVQSAQPAQPVSPAQSYPTQNYPAQSDPAQNYPAQDRSTQIPAPDRRSAYERPIGRTEEPTRSNPYALNETVSPISGENGGLGENESVRNRRAPFADNVQPEQTAGGSNGISAQTPADNDESSAQPATDGRRARRHEYMNLFSKDNPNIFGQSGNRLGKNDGGEEVAATDRSAIFEDEPIVPEAQKGNADAYDDDLYSLRSYDEKPKTVRGSNRRDDNVQDGSLSNAVSFNRGEQIENSDPMEQNVDAQVEDSASTPAPESAPESAPVAPARPARQTADRNFLPHASSPRQQVNSIEPTAPAVSAVEKKEEPAPVEKPRIRKPYVRVPLHYFNCSDTLPDSDATEVEEIKRTILGTLDAYNVTGGSIASVTYGPTLTRYNIVLPLGVSAKKVLSLEQEIAMALCREGVTVALNVGNGAISVEVPNRIRQTVELGCMFVDDAFTKAKPTSLVFAMGKDITNQKIYGDVCKMTHLLVAGSSGSGKSVFLGCLIISLITKYSPDDLRLILIDPKKTEFVLYNNLPHLMVNEIITDCKKAVQSLSWAIGEMERRYSLFEKKTLAGTYVVNIDEYNSNLTDGEEKLPKIVIIVDELADLMLNAKKDMEEKIQSLTQKARAAGIHLILATQRPSTDVITGVIKSNLPTRIAFTVATDVDSRVILDQTGAQKLLGKGDMIYTASGINTPIRVQSPFISSADSQRVVNFIKENNEAFFDEKASSFINNVRASEGGGADEETDPALSDPVYLEALKLAIQMKTASISMLQRKCSIGFNKAGKIIEWMEKRGFISSYEGAKARTVLITREDFINLYGEW